MSYSVPDGNIGAEKRVRSVKHLCKRDGGTSACLMTTTVEHTAVAQHRCIVLACNARRNVNVTVYEAFRITHSEQTTFVYCRSSTFIKVLILLSMTLSPIISLLSYATLRYIFNLNTFDEQLVIRPTCIYQI